MIEISKNLAHLTAVEQFVLLYIKTYPALCKFKGDLDITPIGNLAGPSGWKGISFCIWPNPSRRVFVCVFDEHVPEGSFERPLHGQYRLMVTDEEEWLNAIRAQFARREQMECFQYTDVHSLARRVCYELEKFVKSYRGDEE